MTDPTPDTPPPNRPTGALAKERLAVRARWNQMVNTPEAISDRRIRKWSELWETVILSLATLITAWAGYQAGQWNSIQTAMNTHAHTLQLQAGVLDDRAGKQQLVDVVAFTQWVNATVDGNQAQAAIYEERFRPEFLPAFNAWQATTPLVNADAPATPFAMPEYHLGLIDDAAQLRREAETLNISAVDAGQTADAYTLAIVILAGALLLAGLANRFEWEELRIVVVIAALFILLYSVIRIIVLPMA